MKRKMKLFEILVVSAIAILDYAKTTYPENLHNLLLENIEALAAGENGVNSTCNGSGSIAVSYTHLVKHHASVRKENGAGYFCAAYVQCDCCHGVIVFIG